ncbi:MAG: CaiB/BaiF CoA transferase family protein [Rhodoglobus sp.]
MTEMALSDLKVLDFGWVAAVPILTLQLALHGADVIRAESAARPDASRASGPFIDAEGQISAAFGQLNANKRSIGVDLKAVGARELVLDLVEWADVVTENFRPGTLERLGLGYDVLAERNPRIVMLQSSSAGQGGSLSGMAATGDLLQSLCGFTHLTGYPDQHPMPPWGAWTDITVPPIGIAVILSAVRQAHQTGQGRLLDMSQMELSVAFLVDELVSAQRTGQSPTRQGNRDPRFAPHGVFRAAGADNWVAIAVTDDDQWAALCTVMGKPELAQEYSALADRHANEDSLEQAVEEWTEVRDADLIVQELSERGVGAAVVATSADILSDPQLAHRNYLQYTEHAEVGPMMVLASSFVLSRTPARALTPAPEIGRDSWQVCSEVLGYSDERVAELYVSGAVE